MQLLSAVMRSTHRQERRIFLALLTLAGVATLSIIQVRLALELAPTALLAAILLLGYRPGERLVERIHENRRRRLARRRAKSIELPLESGRSADLFRRLIAFALSMRPPPAFSIS